MSDDRASPPRLDDASARADDLAAELLARRADGEAIDVDAYLAPEPRAMQDAVRERVAAAEGAERRLPRAAGPGSVFGGRYEVVRQIGEGGMGRVYLAKDRELGRDVALKIIAAIGTEGARMQALLKKESRILAALQHPNIVAVHDCGLEDELAWLVMDLVDGRSLADVVDRMRADVERRRWGARDGALWARALDLPEAPGGESSIDEADFFRTAARVVCAIVRTIEAAHARGVVHRDLKPANVMLKSGAVPVVLDFGLAGDRAKEPGDVTTGLFGSVPYLAPEQLRDESSGSDPRTDVYQLGLVLYEVLVLRRAFGGVAMGGVIEKVKNGWFDRPRKANPAVPRELEAICMRALERAPEMRYATARALREDLERYLDGRSVPEAMRSDRRRAFVRAARGLVKRHPVVTSLAAIVVVALGVWLARAPVERAMLQPIKVDRRSPTRVQLVDEGATVRGEDALGLYVSSSRSLVLYALSTFVNAAGEKRGKPVELVRLADLANAPAAGRFGFEVPACESESFRDCPCVIGSWAESANREEGLLVLAFEHDSTDVERWMADLAARYGDAGGPIDDVLAHFPRTVDTFRGRGARETHFTDDEQARFAEHVRKELLERRRARSELPGLVACWFECPVAPD